MALPHQKKKEFIRRKSFCLLNRLVCEGQVFFFFYETFSDKVRCIRITIKCYIGKVNFPTGRVHD